MQTLSLRKLIESTTQQFQDAELYYGHGTDDAAADAYYLVMCALGVDFHCNETELDRVLDSEQIDTVNELIKNRIEQRIPVAYLVNQAWFAGLPFYVDERVLIPRSPIAELIHNHFQPWVKTENVKQILDIGTGSACIPIACAYAFPDAMLDAVDIDNHALEVAKKNIELHDLKDRIALYQSDLFDDLPMCQYDIIISNPPYVSDAEMQTLPPEYTHEPSHALEAENNGLAIVDRILKQAQQYLSEDGILIVEVGNSMEALIEHYADIPFTWLEFEFGGKGVFLLSRQELIRS